MRAEKTRNRWIFAGFLIAATTITCEYLALSPVGSTTLMLPKFLALLLVLLLPLASAALLITVPVLLLRKKPIGPRFQLLAGVLACSLLVGIGLSATPKVRDMQFRAFSGRSAPLIEAISAYTRSRGIPPETLGELVPAFLPEVPGTGMGAYPEFTYDPISTRGVSWSLSVATPAMPMDFDALWYLPDGRYDALQLGPHRMLGVWAFFDD